MGYRTDLIDNSNRIVYSQQNVRINAGKLLSIVIYMSVGQIEAVERNAAWLDCEFHWVDLVNFFFSVIL